MKIWHDEQELELEEGASAASLAKNLKLQAPDQALVVSINGSLCDLQTPLQQGDRIHFHSFDEPEGKEVFWHTSAHILAQAVLRLWPEAKPTIGPPIAQGFYYDFANLHISDEDLPRIEKEMKAIAQANYASERETFATPEEAKEAFSDNPYKIELIESFEEGSTLSAYRQGEFFDLCRGPHLPSLGKVKALKVMRTSGAYWRGDAKKEMLTRIYAISFPDRERLREHLQMLEEAKKRDHKLLGQKLRLFSLKEEAPGLPFIYPAGMRIWNALVDYCRDTFHRHDYVEIKTPMMATRDLWEQSGHWENYREHMFTSEVEERTFAIKPMNCPGGMLFFKSHAYSYRDLPLRVAEIGHVHRNEFSGALSGLFRVRGFHQDDAHIFMRPQDIETEILGALRLADEIYSTFGLTYDLELSTRPEKSIGSEEEWKLATRGLQNALDKLGKPYRINEGDGAFYGPKIDFHIRDALGRTWQCGTIQVDMALPERFDLEYTDEDGERKRPVMIHRALFGSIERFFGILTEHFAGNFPLWMSPRPLRILTIADRHIPYAEELANRLRREGFFVEVDASGESMGKKVRTAQLDKCNYILTVGDTEVEHRTLSLRTRDNIVHGEVPLESFLETILTERKHRRIHTPYVKEACTP